MPTCRSFSCWVVVFAATCPQLGYSSNRLLYSRAVTHLTFTLHPFVALQGGWTPLFFAAACGRSEEASLLLAAGAPPAGIDQVRVMKRGCHVVLYLPEHARVYMPLVTFLSTMNAGRTDAASYRR
jgi:hypothetical protein